MSYEYDSENPEYTLSQEEKERIFRSVLLNYDIEDAHNMVEAFLEERIDQDLANRDEIIEQALPLFAYEDLAETFELDHDMSIADREQWMNIIRNHIIQDNPGLKALLKSAKTNLCYE